MPDQRSLFPVCDFLYLYQMVSPGGQFCVCVQTIPVMRTTQTITRRSLMPGFFPKSALHLGIHKEEKPFCQLWVGPTGKQANLLFPGKGEEFSYSLILRIEVEKIRQIASSNVLPASHI